MRRSLVLIVAAGLLVAADDRDDEAVKKKELKKHEGTWMVVSQVRDGKKTSPETLTRFRVVFSGDGRFAAVVGEKVVQESALTVDPKKTPKTFDVFFSETVKDGKKVKGPPIYGIYEFKDDMRRICYIVGGSAEDRPTEFSSKAGSGFYMEVQKRVKE